MTAASMLLVPSVERASIAALVTLAAGVHTLPETHAAMTNSVERSIASFAAEVPADETYTFVLEDSHSGALLGNACPQQFRAVPCAAPAIDASDSIAVSAEARRSLQVAPGDTIHCVKS
jgi:arginine/ornithine N-succinyltransferase beta subunit